MSNGFSRRTGRSPPEIPAIEPTAFVAVGFFDPNPHRRVTDPFGSLYEAQRPLQTPYEQRRRADLPAREAAAVTCCDALCTSYPSAPCSTFCADRAHEEAAGPHHIVDDPVGRGCTRAAVGDDGVGTVFDEWRMTQQITAAAPRPIETAMDTWARPPAVETLRRTARATRPRARSAPGRLDVAARGRLPRGPAPQHRDRTRRLLADAVRARRHRPDQGR